MEVLMLASTKSSHSINTDTNLKIDFISHSARAGNIFLPPGKQYIYIFLM